MKKIAMNKILGTFLCCSILALTTACGSGQEAGEAGEAQINTARSEVAETKEIDDSQDTLDVTIKGDVKITLNRIKAGSFDMGTPEGLGGEDELPVHKVKISQDFFMGIYEVTQEQWEAVMGSNPSTFKGDKLPVETVSWGDCLEFCQKLSEMTGYEVGLPTEAQWEYACRAGSSTKWFFGDKEKDYGKYACDDTSKKTQEVGKYEPNKNGLYDMYGNVMEWCLDYYSEEYDKKDNEDPLGAELGESRVNRGGGWGASPDDCRSGYRNAAGESDATDGIGFRVIINS
ncbi:MAG: formylglycine-generating enzyme family protein [Eubacterium sp.]|nr:formylglycine-generating enzyme family protein [Eubacterium sp.]